MQKKVSYRLFVNNRSFFLISPSTWVKEKKIEPPKLYSFQEEALCRAEGTDSNDGTVGANGTVKSSII